LFSWQGLKRLAWQRFNEIPAGHAVYACFNERVDSRLSQVCFEGPEAIYVGLFTPNQYFATSIAALTLFQEKSLLSCGDSSHSLGEYAALYAAGSLI